MITARAWSGRRYAVLGLARSGAATVEALLASGAEVVAWDSNPDARAALSPSPSGEGLGVGAVHKDSASSCDIPHPNPSPEGEGLLSFADPLTLDLTGFAGVVVSPGVPINTHPIAAHARAHGVPLIGDIELFAQARADLPPHKVVGITGTNGKSTTTALVHHILKTAGVPTTMGGNIGLPILAQEPLTPNDTGVGVYVLELSSYQIDLTRSLDCDVAVLTNVTPDHLDRYEGFDAYRASKERLFEMQSVGRVAVVGESIWHHQKGLYDRWFARRNDRLWCAPNVGDADPFDRGWFDDVDRLTTQDDWPALQGPHNFENALVAIMVCRALGFEDEQIAPGLESFPGLPHRMERVRDCDGVLFVNDSKGTNPDATAPALAAFPHIHWIVGGRSKTDDLGPCADQLGHVRGAYTIGEAGPMFARLLDGKVPVTQSHVLDRAVIDAAAAAKPGEVVLLSPACSSFDQYRDFEARGEAFRAAVEALP